MRFFNRRNVLIAVLLGLFFLGDWRRVDARPVANEIFSGNVLPNELRLLNEWLGTIDGTFRGVSSWWIPVLCLSPFVVVLVWWLSLRPSHNRDWSPEYALAPWAEIEGDKVTIHNFRNFDYRTEKDFTARWETRTFHLSKLCGLDLFMNYWGSPHIAHTLLSFDFGDDGYVCTSIETRRQRHEGYSAIRGFFRQFELYYVIGDERDLVRLRTHCREQEVYLYPLVKANPERYRALFLAYLRSANDLRNRPRWYHAALSNCTSNIRLNATTSGFVTAWDWRMLVNGYLDELLHQRGIISSSIGFAETKARALISARARSHESGLDFSKAIRTPNSMNA